MVLAMYTIRSKQDYIYKTNKIVEIMGASEIISKAWDVLFEQAEKNSVKTKRDIAGGFSFDEVKNALEEKEYQMYELFCGGGNETVLYDTMDTYKKVNRCFSCYVLKKYPGLIPMAVAVEVHGNYREDYRDLMLKSEVEKSRMTPAKDSFVLPFSMIDQVTLEPMSEIKIFDKTPERCSRESMSKRTVGIASRNKNKDVKILDKLATKRGEESMLAVVHADGNNMGSKIMDLLGDETSYDYCINAMRRFTRTTADVFGRYGLEAIEKRREELEKENVNNRVFLDKDGKLKKSSFVFRKVIADGDDVTFICNARFVMEYVEAYIRAVSNYQSEMGVEWSYSSCAGICLFHSHYSFAEAYRIAEMACDDGAKEKVHGKKQIPGIEEGWADFHYLHSGVGGDLLTIRQMQGTDSCMARPWLLTQNEKNNEVSYEMIKKLVSILKEYKVSRSDIKNLGIDWESSREEGKRSLIRVLGHHKGLKERMRDGLKWSEDQLMKAMYDVAEVYDLWFAEG